MAPLRLNDRDLALLYYTWQNRILDLRHYGRKFWPQAPLETTARRLAMLSDAGFLRCTRLPQLPQHLLFSATGSGNKKLAEIGLIHDRDITDYPRQATQFTPALHHDLSVTDIRIAFEETGANAATWQSDHQLRLARVGLGPNTRTPDGVFEYQEQGELKKGVLELELSPYRRRVLALTLRRLSLLYGDHNIFFICRNAPRAATFRSWCLDLATWNDRPTQLRIGCISTAIETGLRSAFVNLREI